MAKVRRFTTRYDPTEDRVRMAVELHSDEVKTLWLSRRMLNRLIPTLLKQLSAAGVAAGTPPAQAGVAQKFSQQAAMSHLRKQPDVVPSKGSEDAPPKEVGVLVTSVDVHKTSKGIVLGFKEGETVLQMLPFGENELRQWLNVLLRQYQAGDWRERFWPAWMRPEARVADPERLN